eukprot:Skav227519  [mRNA]  locus=scaffold2269:65549:72877:- [translate_table: standard]
MNLRNNGIGDEGLESIAEGVTTLKLRQNDKLGESAALALVLALKTDVGDWGALVAHRHEYLVRSARCQQALETLDLRNCRLGPAAAKTLASALLPNGSMNRRALRVLHLDRNLFGFDGAVLTLRENRLGDGGVGAISEVGDLGAQSLGLLLQKEPRLSSLCLKGNGIGDVVAVVRAESQQITWALGGDAGAATVVQPSRAAQKQMRAEALAQGVQKNSWLEELDLSKNQIKMVGQGLSMGCPGGGLKPMAGCPVTMAGSQEPASCAQHWS